MADGFVQLPPDSTGKKLRTRDRGTAGHDQYVAVSAAETWVALADTVASANGKQHISIFNATGSGKLVKLRKLFAINLQTAAVTGIVQRFDIKRTTAQSAGTAITPRALDTANAALPAQVTVATAATVTEGVLLFPWVTSSEEETAVPALSKSLFQQSVNVLLEGNEIQELALREGEGATVKQAVNSTVGSFAWLLAFTVE